MIRNTEEAILMIQFFVKRLRSRAGISESAVEL